MPRRDSDSDDSYRSRSRRKKSKKKSRRSSSSSLSTRSSSSGSSKPRRYARSRSRERSKYRHKSSRTKHRRRSRSSSSDSRSRSRKHSKKERSRRSSSRSRSRGRSIKTPKESRSSSPRKSKVKESVHKKEREIEGNNATKVSDGDALRDKLEAALKAAAVADAQLRQKGLLPDTSQKPQAATVQDQLKRAQIIDEINSDSFTQKDFVSNRNWGNKTPQVPAENTSVEEVETNKNGSLPSADDWKTNPEKLVHPSWFEDTQLKMEQWKRKLSELRGAKCNGNEIKKEI